MPRAALLSLHARIGGIESTGLDDPSLAQLWGPRYSTYVVPKQDFAVFSLGRLPDERAYRVAELLHPYLVAEHKDRDLGALLGMDPNVFKRAAPTGTIAIRWEGARAPVMWKVEAPDVDPVEMCRELARRYLHVFGPTTADSFVRWAGISKRAGSNAFSSLDSELIPVRTPLGDEWLLAADEPAMLAEGLQPAPARLLPSGDAYFLLDGRERELLVPKPAQQALLWTSRVWPGALLVGGEIRGTWRRAQHSVRVETWGKLSRAERDAVEAEAAALPLPIDREIVVAYD
jgi:winged helix DNA-binding protein